MVVILLLAALALAWIAIDSIKIGISPTPSSLQAREAIAALIPSRFEGRIVDVGCGWGDLAVFLAKHFPASTVIGYEISYLPYWISLLRAPKNLELIHRDFFADSLHASEIIVCYLYPDAMTRLKPKLERELQTGTLVISNTFAVPGWTPVKVIVLDDLYRTKVYLYSFSNEDPHDTNP